MTEQADATNENSVVEFTGDPITTMIERVATDPNIPMERLEKLLDMKERMEDRALAQIAREAERNYHAAMADCQAEIPAIKKNKKNDHTRSTYADLQAIEEYAMPIIHRHGFSVSFTPAGQKDGSQLIRWKVAHKSGHMETDIAEVPIDAAGSQGKVNKTSTQAFGSTNTYGRRYLLCMLFNIATGDDNDGNQTSNPITKAQLQELRNLLDQTGSAINTFCNMWGINALPELLQANFEPAMKQLNHKLFLKSKKEQEQV
jgi:hypothetical protein